MRILIADDSNVSRHLLESIVRKWGYEVTSTADGTQAWEVLRRDDAPRLAILDWMMPGLTGPQVCELVRKKGSESYIYILLLTGRTQKEDVIEGMMAGADDYVVKPFDQQELNVRLRAGRRIVELQDELLTAREALRVQATHDGLTRLFNRGRIMEVLEEATTHAGLAGTPLGVIMLDLDRFKSINDNYGHVVGDAVLAASAVRLREALGPGDAVGRYGGEEFLVVSRRSADDLMALAECIRLAISREPVRDEDVAVPVTASLGVAAFDPQVTADAMVRAADAALYQAKRQGRDRVVLGAVEVPHASRDAVIPQS